jgi:hypothetical protein
MSLKINLDEVNDNNNENNGVVSRAKNEDCKDKNASGESLIIKTQS